MKTFINRVFEKIWMALVVIFTVAILGCIVVLFMPELLPTYITDDVSSQIGLAQLIIEIATFFTFLITAWELRQIQKKPGLDLWMLSTDSLIPTKNISNFHVPVRNLISNPPNIICEFNFNLLIENRGSAIARFVKVSIEVSDQQMELSNGLNSKNIQFYRISNEPVSGSWIPIQNDQSNKHEFHGGDDFVSYSHPKSSTPDKGLMDDIGAFKLRIPLQIKDTSQYLTLKGICYLEADGFPREKRELVFIASILEA